jgi:hypothetical protein
MGKANIDIARATTAPNADDDISIVYVGRILGPVIDQLPALAAWIGNIDLHALNLWDMQRSKWRANLTAHRYHSACVTLMFRPVYVAKTTCI